MYSEYWVAALSVLQKSIIVHGIIFSMAKEKYDINTYCTVRSKTVTVLIHVDSTTTTILDITLGQGIFSYSVSGLIPFFVQKQSFDFRVLSCLDLNQ